MDFGVTALAVVGLENALRIGLGQGRATSPAAERWPLGRLGCGRKQVPGSLSRLDK